MWYIQVSYYASSRGYTYAKKNTIKKTTENNRQTKTLHHFKCYIKKVVSWVGKMILTNIPDVEDQRKHHL